MMYRQLGRLLLATAALACSGSLGASAQVRTLTTVSGVPLRLTHHSVFSFKTCATAGLPQVTAMKASEGGKLWQQTEQAKLENSTSQQGEHCIGKSVPSVVIYYQAKPNWTGTETVEYLVKFPSSCASCQNRTLTFAINVTPPSGPAAPPPETGAAEQTPQMSGSTFR